VRTEGERTQIGTDRQGRPIFQLPLAHYGSPTPEQTVARAQALLAPGGAVCPAFGLNRGFQTSGLFGYCWIRSDSLG
jgi:hypothetical protein